MEIYIRNLDEMGEKALDFIKAIGRHRVLAFYGKMGAGKTTFIRALCDALGVKEPVTSPTFAIVNEYRATMMPESMGGGEAPVYHFDFYRIRRLEEAYDLGFEDYVYSGDLCLIEWPELIEDLLPEDALHIDISVTEDGTRVITLPL
ncbi:MAG: tRNA (adenosine(37)-N6)-threonylcarbamoyltransferase complex ATPase subunit type 1 TsaE [Bacteroidales bacterium]|nr:tRNA (adenosine(37)-N6)-threonylcarbamoyltransferase complex ATPase subunit type 1 TsaE [Bacteroidales bacterium]